MGRRGHWPAVGGSLRSMDLVGLAQGRDSNSTQRVPAGSTIKSKLRPYPAMSAFPEGGAEGFFFIGLTGLYERELTKPLIIILKSRHLL